MSSEPLTPKQSQKVAQSLYTPTLTRVGILIDNLIRLTNNGDFALWAPLMAMESALKSLQWSATDSPERFLFLISAALRRYADKCDAYTLGLTAARAANAPAPAFEAWSDKDTIAVYDETDARFPFVPAEPEPPAEPDGTAPSPAEEKQ